MWFSNHLAGALIYMPAALVGGLLPFRLAHRRGVSIATQVAGSCLFNAILAVILTVVGGKVAYSHFSWAAAAYISLWIVPKVRSGTLLRQEGLPNLLSLCYCPCLPQLGFLAALT